MPGICYVECSLQNLWASFAMSWTAGNSLWSDFGTLTLLLVSFYINENVDTVNGYKHRINSGTQVFLQYICNWCEDATSCASRHWRLNR